MTDASDALQVVYDRIREEIRPKVDKRPGVDLVDGEMVDSLGYNCCGCSTYLQIVEDIEAIVRAEYKRVGGK